jgi:tryptophan-rich sensory protein
MTTYLEEVISFFLWVGGTYAVGAAVALYVYFKTGAVTYESGRSKDMQSSVAAEKIWYMRLRKLSFTPGTTAYAIGWGAGYLFFGYAVWRVWIADAARESPMGIGVLSLALIHWAALGFGAWLTFGRESLVLGMIGQLLNLATSAAVTGLIWKLHADGAAAFIGAGTSAAVYTFVHLIAVIVHLGLLVKRLQSKHSTSI